MRIDILERKDDIKGWIDINQSKSFMCRELKCKPETLNWWLEKMGMAYNGNQGGRGIKTDPRCRTAKEYAELPSCRSCVLKKKLVKEGYLDDVCDECSIGELWMDKPITLELDHIDGDRYNNDFDNLRILCPNCHSQTETFRKKKSSLG